MIRSIYHKTIVIMFIFCGFIYGCSFEPPEAKVYLEQTVPFVVKHWDLNDLRKYSGSCLLKHLDGGNKETFKSLFAQCAKKLGSLKSLGGSEITFLGDCCGKEGSTAMYKCRTLAVFEKGNAVIKTSVYINRDRHGEKSSGQMESFDIELQ